MRVPTQEIPQSILIVKLSAIGDVIQTLPMLEALKKQYPQALIDWVVEEDASALLLNHPRINRVIVSRRKSWLKKVLKAGEFWRTLREMGRFIRELRSRHYDWIIDNHGIFKSGLLVLLSRGRRKIGFQASTGIADEGSYFFTHERYKPLSIDRHALERYLNLVSQMGVQTDPMAFHLPVPPESVKRAEDLLRDRGFGSRPLVVLHPMAKWETKQWPVEKFARLVSALARRGASVVITGSPHDEGPVREILHRAGDSLKVLNLAGKTNLMELAGIFSLSDLVLSPDTGPMHLAAAVKAPLIALFGPTAPWRTGPYGDSSGIIRKELPCSPCFKKRCQTMECMTSISVEEVLDAVDKKLKEKKIHREGDDCGGLNGGGIKDSWNGKKKEGEVCSSCANLSSKINREGKSCP
ncbi:MAG: rfaF [Deltaproteobacteria bacterium]|nr:rfaF [Deltaproteobacteria bacterium]